MLFLSFCINTITYYSVNYVNIKPITDYDTGKYPLECMFFTFSSKLKQFVNSGI